MPAARRNRTHAEVARNFLDLDPKPMLQFYWPNLRSRCPRNYFYNDPKLRTFANGLQVLCIELETPGTVFWPDCEPFASYLALVGHSNPNHDTLVDLYFRTVGVLRARANLLSRRGDRLDKGGDPTKGLVLETALWNARESFISELQTANTQNVVTFLRSCAFDLKNHPLPPLPLPTPVIHTNPPQAETLMKIFACPNRPTRPPATVPRRASRDIDEAGLVRMYDSDDEDRQR